MLKVIILSISLLSLGACSSSGKKGDSPSSASKSSGVRCEKAVKIGSHIGKRRCTTKKQRDTEKKQAEEIMQRTQRAGSSGDNNNL
ncbi:MAG: hypothetical protein ACJAS9_000487 [Polaribacter sp.]|jgi:hypothetical protein